MFHESHPARFASVEAIIAALGGPTLCGGLIGVRGKNVHAWARRNSIPVEYWPALIDSGPGRLIRLTADDLMRACAGVPLQSGGASAQLPETTRAYEGQHE